MLMRFILIFSALSLLSTAGPISPSITGLQPGKVQFTNGPQDFEVAFFPVEPYHIGDLVSVRVTYTGTGEIEGKEIVIALSEHPQIILGTEKFDKYDRQADFHWILDTSTRQPGFIQFNFEIPAVGLAWQDGINLLPAREGNHGEWAFVETECCTIHYIKGSDADRDIAQIEDTLEKTADKALNQFYPAGIPQENPLAGEIDLALIPAIIGHGGFATDIAVVTYTDRNWVGSSFETIVHHEIVHVLDRKLNNEGPRPSILSEGIAVYLSGGHYRKGDPLLRASALVKTGQYIPLSKLADDFHNAQHEIAYMEGAALVAYMVELWGWEDFLNFYFNLEQNQSASRIISSALEEKTGKDLTTFEKEFVSHLNTLVPEKNIISDVNLTIEVYNMIRRYQSLVVPSAHYRTAWWPPIDKVLEMGTTGDYDRREKAPLNIIIEARFLEIQKAFDEAEYKTIENNLDTINNYLNIIENSEHSPSHYDLGWPPPERPLFINKP